MVDELLARFAGSYAAVGGGVWAVVSFVQAWWPNSCVGQECVASPTGSPVFLTLAQTVGLMFVAIAGGCLVLAVRRGRLGVPGAIAGAIGLFVCVAALLLMVPVTTATLLFDVPSSGAMVESEALVALPVLLVGVTVVGCVVLGVGVLPRAVGAFLLVGSVLLATSDEFVPAVIQAVAGGMCWCAAGAVVLLHTSSVEASRQLVNGRISALD
jgi:hypothetical protein